MNFATQISPLLNSSEFLPFVAVIKCGEMVSIVELFMKSCKWEETERSENCLLPLGGDLNVSPT